MLRANAPGKMTVLSVGSSKLVSETNALLLQLQVGSEFLGASLMCGCCVQWIKSFGKIRKDQFGRTLCWCYTYPRALLGAAPPVAAPHTSFRGSVSEGPCPPPPASLCSLTLPYSVLPVHITSFLSVLIAWLWLFDVWLVQVVQGFEDSQALDLQSVVCLEERNPIGVINRQLAGNPLCIYKWLYIYKRYNTSLIQ